MSRAGGQRGSVGKGRTFEKRACPTCQRWIAVSVDKYGDIWFRRHNRPSGLPCDRRRLRRVGPQGPAR